MSKRKPPVPRRRIGAHFIESAVQRSVHRNVRRDGAAASFAAKSVAMNGPQKPADSAAAGATAASLPADDAQADVPVSQSANMHTTPVSKAMASHLQQIGRSLVSTVPLRQSDAHVGEQHGHSTLKGTSEPPQQGETVTMPVAELEAWKQRTIMQIEDHFTNEQLKRIAEFGRVHANLVKEAKEYVFGIETQLKAQFERERESLKAQAEAYVAQFQQENERLRQHIQVLEGELEELRGDAGEGEDQQSDGGGSVDVSVDVGVGVALLGAETVVNGQTPLVKRTHSQGSEGGPKPPGSGGSREVRMRIHSPEPPGDGERRKDSIQLEAVTESLHRAMEIRTPRSTDANSNNDAASSDADGQEGDEETMLAVAEKAIALEAVHPSVDQYL